jgi:hypothetical protein
VLRIHDILVTDPDPVLDPDLDGSYGSGSATLDKRCERFNLFFNRKSKNPTEYLPVHKHSARSHPGLGFFFKYRNI